MAKYFNYFPKTFYSANNSSVGLDSVTNITARFGFENSLKQNSSAFYKYNIQESDTPEIIARKYYDNSERHWIVLMMNDMVDPNYDWPLDQRTIIKYIDNKYTVNANTSAGQTGIQWAQNNTHSYYKIETRTDQQTNTITKDTIQVDANTYANVVASTESIQLDDGNTITITVSKETKTYFDYETDENENKRTIKLLKSEFVESVEKEFDRIMNG